MPNEKIRGEKMVVRKLKNPGILKRKGEESRIASAYVQEVMDKEWRSNVGRSKREAERQGEEGWIKIADSS